MNKTCHEGRDCARGHGEGRDHCRPEMESPDGRHWRHSLVPEDNLYGLMRQAGHYLFHKANGNVAHGQERILQILRQQDSVSQRELQHQLGIQPGSMSEILNKLEEKEMIVRRRDSEDQRRVIVSLTDKGREQTSYLLQGDHDTGDLFKALSIEEQEQLKILLTKLVGSWLDSERKQ